MSVDQAGYIYLCFDSSGLWKIGIAKNVKKRLEQMRTGNPSIKMAAKFFACNPQKTEKELHKKFEDNRVAGEWFNLSPTDLFYIYNLFLGKNNTHGYGDFVIIHDIISIQKKASSRLWLNELSEWERINE